MFKILSLYLLSGITLVNFSIAAPTIRLNTTGQPPLNTPEMTGFMDLVSKEAFKRINIELKTVQLPAERGLKNANLGIEDGEMSRIYGMETKYPNLIRVPEKIMDWEFVAFSAKEIELDNGWNSLESHSVAYINGWKILENHLKYKGVIKVRNSNQLFTLLKNRRTEVIVYELWGGLLKLREFGITKVKKLNPSLAVKNMYIYLHKKHEKLVPSLSQALISLKKDGSYQKYFDMTLKELAQ